MPEDIWYTQSIGVKSRHSDRRIKDDRNMHRLYRIADALSGNFMPRNVCSAALSLLVPAVEHCGPLYTVI